MIKLNQTARRSNSMVNTRIERNFSPASTISDKKSLPTETKSNRRRMIDFSRRRTLNESMRTTSLNNKENLSRISNNDSEKKNQSVLYFNRPINESARQNSFSTTSVIARIPRLSSSVQRRASIHFLPTRTIYRTDSFEDFLCDREVESYFYPSRQMPTWKDFSTPSKHLIRGTLC